MDFGIVLIFDKSPSILFSTRKNLLCHAGPAYAICLLSFRVEESLMGRNAARRFQKEINEIDDDHVALLFLPLWKKIIIKMQKFIKKHFKKQDLLVHWDKEQLHTSEPGKYTQNTFMVEYFTQPAEYEIQNLLLTEQPTEMDDGLDYDKWEF
jgi:hypothetical protein